jgi:integration host factor subunit beta
MRLRGRLAEIFLDIVRGGTRYSVSQPGSPDGSTVEISEPCEFQMSSTDTNDARSMDNLIRRTTTKKELVDRIAADSNLSRADVKRTIQAFLDEVIEELDKGNRLEFRDFGVFEIRQRAARRAQNPKTLEQVEVPARRTVKFKPGRLMKVKVEQADDE